MEKYIPVDSYVANTDNLCPELYICSGVTWMVTILQTNTVKMECSLNSNVSKFNSGLCYWILYYFIMLSSETLGWFWILLITICSRRKQPLVSNDVLLWEFSMNTLSVQSLYLVCCLSLFSIVVWNFLDFFFCFSPKPLHFQ